LLQLARRLSLSEEVSAMDVERKYRFTWEQLGDVDLGRPNLGPYAKVEVYRLMQLCVRDAIESEYGMAATDRIFYRAGYLAGEELYRNALGHITGLKDFFKKLQSVLREMGIGILRIEESDLDNGRFVITVSEDLDCSGLPETGYEICTYDEGLIAALLNSFTGKKFDVKEVDCWCTGSKACRFVAEMSE
jgi:hypothetical protein